MNSIQLTGNLCKDVELRESSSGKKVVSNTIAVNKNKKNAMGEYESDFINIVCFDYNAERISKYAKKRDKIAINGKLRVEPYTDKEGNYKTNTYVVVDSIEFMTTRKQQEEHKEIEISEDEFPF